MHAQPLGRWQHDHVFLGTDHERNRRRTLLVTALTLAMMVGEIVAGTVFGSMALLADGWHMATHAGALGLSALIEGPDAIVAGIAAFGWRPALSTLYTAGLCTLVGYAIFNGLLARNRSASVVPWVLLAPVVAMVSAALLLGQVPNVWETVGGAVLVVGVFVANAPSRRRVVLPAASQLETVGPRSG